MMKRNRKTETLATCIFELVLGILLLVNPIGFTSGIIVGTGVILTAFGIFSLVDYFRSDPYTASEKGGLTKGLLFVMGGLFCVLKPKWFITTFPIFTTFYGILILVSGVSKLQWAVDMLRKKQPHWYVALISAILSLIFATLVLANPFTSTAVLWNFIAVSLIVESIADIVTYFFNRK